MVSMDLKSRQCILKILGESEKSLSTQEMLDIAIKYPELCRGCKSGSNILSIIMKMYREGKVQREITKGGLRWMIK